MRFSHRLHAVLQPLAHLQVVDVHVLDADEPRVGGLQPPQDLPQRQHVAGTEGPGGEDAVQVGLGEAVVLQGQFRRGRGRLLQRDSAARCGGRAPGSCAPAGRPCSGRPGPVRPRGRRCGSRPSAGAAPPWAANQSRQAGGTLVRILAPGLPEAVGVGQAQRVGIAQVVGAHGPCRPAAVLRRPVVGPPGGGNTYFFYQVYASPLKMIVLNGRMANVHRTRPGPSAHRGGGRRLRRRIRRAAPAGAFAPPGGRCPARRPQQLLRLPPLPHRGRHRQPAPAARGGGPARVHRCPGPVDGRVHRRRPRPQGHHGAAGGARRPARGALRPPGAGRGQRHQPAAGAGAAGARPAGQGRGRRHRPARPGHPPAGAGRPVRRSRAPPRPAALRRRGQQLHGRGGGGRVRHVPAPGRAPLRQHPHHGRGHHRGGQGRPHPAQPGCGAGRVRRPQAAGAEHRPAPGPHGGAGGAGPRGPG